MEITRSSDGSLIFRTTVEVVVPPGTSMLEAEELLMQEINKTGADITGGILTSRDADGKPLEKQGRKLTAKVRKEPRHVETPYGCAVVECWAYQTSAGGVCHYPMVTGASLVGAATPKFAQMVSRKMVELPAAEVVRDLRENHARKVTVDFVQRLTGLVGALAAAAAPVPACAGADESLPQPEEVKVISIGVDGACVLMNQRQEDAADPDQRKQRRREWRTAMVGTITFYDGKQNRLGSIYAATAPPEDKEEGKAVFWEVMSREIAAVKRKYPRAKYAGLSDGASDFPPWLRQHTSQLVLDFYHASGYVYGAAAAFGHEPVPEGEPEDYWALEACRHLRYDEGAAANLLEAFQQRLASSPKLGEEARKALERAITYFTNNLDRMNYAQYEAAGLPLGSGVTEAACKLLVKKRLCGPGMAWGFTMAGHILRLRALAHSAGGRWKALWKGILTPEST